MFFIFSSQYRCSGRSVYSSGRPPCFPHHCVCPLLPLYRHQTHSSSWQRPTPKGARLVWILSWIPSDDRNLFVCVISDKISTFLLFIFINVGVFYRELVINKSFYSVQLSVASWQEIPVRGQVMWGCSAQLLHKDSKIPLWTGRWIVTISRQTQSTFSRGVLHPQSLEWKWKVLHKLLFF